MPCSLEPLVVCNYFTFFHRPKPPQLKWILLVLRGSKSKFHIEFLDWQTKSFKKKNIHVVALVSFQFMMYFKMMSQCMKVSCSGLLDSNKVLSLSFFHINQKQIHPVSHKSDKKLRIKCCRKRVKHENYFPTI